MKRVRVGRTYELDFETAATWSRFPVVDGEAVDPPRPPGTGWRVIEIIAAPSGTTVFYWERLKPRGGKGGK